MLHFPGNCSEEFRGGPSAGTAVTRVYSWCGDIEDAANSKSAGVHFNLRISGHSPRSSSNSQSASAISAIGSTLRKNRIVSESKKALDTLTDLPDNWNFSLGKTPRGAEIAATKSLLERLAPHLTVTPFFYPAPEGGIVTEFGNGANRLTIILESDFLLGVSFAQGDHATQEFDISQGITEDAVTWLTARLDELGA